MSVFDAPAPQCETKVCPPDVDMVLIPRSVDLGGFQVNRILPAHEKRMVGPFVFWDQFGPSEFEAGKGVDVRPHPHIGLCTLTYLFTGSMDHRDNLGSHQVIIPGDVNFMTAGKGIAHSERTGQKERSLPHSLFGIQCWLGLPTANEEIDPDFKHIGIKNLPHETADGVTMRMIAGSMHGISSPLKTVSTTLFADITIASGSKFSVPADTEERAIHIVSGNITIDNLSYRTAQMLILQPGHSVTLEANNDARIVVLGGDTLDGPRHVWWNFVSSSKDRIEQAKQDWLENKFALIPGDDKEFIPLPD